MKIFLLLTVLATTAAQAATTIVVGMENADAGRTKYTFTISGGTPAAALRIHLGIDSSFGSPLVGSTMKRVSAIPADDPANRPPCADPCYEGTPTTQQPNLTLVLDAKTSDSIAGVVDWTSSNKESGKVMAPIFAFDPGFFSVLLGAGTLMTSLGVTNYEVLQNTNTLSATGIGRNNLDLLLGGSFNLGFKAAGLKNLSAFISLKFSPGSQDAINGFVFGGGYRLTKYLDVVAGVGLTPRHEPAIGLRRVAYNIVKQNPTDPIYMGFIPEDLLLNRGQAAFDGFPLQRNGRPIYEGTPLELHYRTGAFIGVAFPLKLKAALAGQ